MNPDNFSAQSDLEVSPYKTTSDLQTDLHESFQRVVDSGKNTFPQLSTGQSGNKIGIDTLKIGFNICLSHSQLIGWHRTKESVVLEFGNRSISMIYSRRHQTKNGGKINFRYIPVNYQGKLAPLLLVEFTSVPKLLGICSHSQTQDWEKDWDDINEILSEVPFLMKIPDIRDGIVYRVDLSANFQVGENVQNFLNIISQRYFPHRIIQIFPGKQVIFSSNDFSVSFYNKYRLCKKDKRCNYVDAAGILRMEIQMRKKRQAQKWLGLNAPTLRMVTMQKVMARLVKDLCILKLDKPVSGSLVQRILISKDLTRTERKNLVAYVNLRDSQSREELKEFYSVRAISGHEKKLLGAGLSGQTTSKELKDTLPSLLSLLQAGNDIEKIPVAHKS